MAKCYQQAPREIEEAVEATLQEFRPDLDCVQVGCLIVSDPDAPGPCLEHHGYPAAAVVKIVSQKDRAAGLPDAIIVFDYWTWKECSEERRTAIIDHELYHLELARDKDGQVKEDALGRQVLTMRRHDIVIGGFSEIIRRHRHHAIECEQVDAALAARDSVLAQQLLPFEAVTPAAKSAAASN